MASTSFNRVTVQCYRAKTVPGCSFHFGSRDHTKSCSRWQYSCHGIWNKFCVDTAFDTDRIRIIRACVRTSGRAYLSSTWMHACIHAYLEVLGFNVVMRSSLDPERSMRSTASLEELFACMCVRESRCVRVCFYANQGRVVT